jgi:hypothetical protein
MRQGAAVWRCGRHACWNPPGWSTEHEGWGACSIHIGPDEDWLWIMALRIAAEENISPWDALLKSVRVAANRAAWVDQTLADVVAANDGDMGVPAVRHWLKESRLERTLLAKMAKAAIDAGVAERMVRQVELEGQLVAEAVVAALDALALSPEDRTRALEMAHQRLLGEGTGVSIAVQGTVLHDERGPVMRETDEPKFPGDVGYNEDTDPPPPPTGAAGPEEDQEDQEDRDDDGG